MRGGGSPSAKLWDSTARSQNVSHSGNEAENIPESDALPNPASIFM